MLCHHYIVLSFRSSNIHLDDGQSVSLKCVKVVFNLVCALTIHFLIFRGYGDASLPPQITIDGKGE